MASPLHHKESTRYLGVWVSLFNNNQYVIKQIRDEINRTKHVLNKKQLTAKHMIAIFNIVVIPRILYKTKLTFVPHPVCEVLMTSFRTFFKKKLGLSRLISASVLHSTFG